MERSRLERLVDYLWQNQYKEFCYGKHDCGLFVTKWVDAELGTSYTHEVDVRVRRRSGGSQRAALSLRTSGAYQRIAAEFAQHPASTELDWTPGDVAIFTQDDHVETLGILSTRLVHAPGMSGLISMDASRVICHWSLSCLKYSQP